MPQLAAFPTESEKTVFAVELDNVTKRFGEHVAVDNLTLRVPNGSVYGFIGPNGSGKTTSMRMIMHILYPNQGQIRVFGQDIVGQGTVSDRVAYLPEDRGLYKTMKVRDLLRFYAELRSCTQPKQKIDHWLERLGIAEWANKKIQTLSKGMSQKVQFIATIIGEPELIILDEPFTGLDPVNADLFRDVILDLRKQGATVILSTHDMSVAERMCDSIFMIFRGKKVLDGSLDDIQSSYGTDTLRVRVDLNGHDLDGITGVTDVSDFGKYQELRVAPGTDTQQVLTEIMQRGRVRHFELSHPSLHDIFVRIAGPGAVKVQMES
jgi:ABC-2 type transport system ATP-binding protein